ESCLLTVASETILRFDTFPWPDEAQLHHVFLRRNRAREFARRLCEYDWTWLHSTQPFVISDNPLVRWNPKRNRWNCGINTRDIEITIPLGLNLCLRLSQGPKIECECLLDCDAKETRVYNWRQRFAAFRYIYGNSVEALGFVMDREHAQTAPAAS